MPETAALAGPDRRAIEADCARVVLSVFRDLDAFDYPRLIGHFSADAMWEREGRELTGHAQILAALGARPRNQWVCHLITNLIVDATSASGARARGYNTAYRALEVEPGMLPARIDAPLGLWALDAGLTCREGVWRIDTLRQARQFTFAA